mgnify:CR=1 FL=1
MSQELVQRDSTAGPAVDQPRPSPWIIGAAWDLLLFIATPLVILPLLWFSRQKFSPDSIYHVVAAFGATGHHLPGLLRAYGDRTLFHRFRIRFTIAQLSSRSRARRSGTSASSRITRTRPISGSTTSEVTDS